MNVPPDFEAFSRNAQAIVGIAQQLDEARAAQLDTQQRERLNGLLNELTGLNYRHLQLADFKLTHRLFSALTNIPVTEDTLLVKACALIVAIISAATSSTSTALHHHHQSLHIGVLNRLIDWFLRAVRANGHVALCDALHTIRWLIKGNAGAAVPELSRSRRHALSDMLRCILGDLKGGSASSAADCDATAAQNDSCTPFEIQLAASQCLETVCTHLTLFECTEDDAELQLLSDLLRSAVTGLYDLDGAQFEEQPHCVCAAALLNSCRLLLAAIGKVSAGQQADVVAQRIGELLGAAKAFMMHGLPDVPRVRPPVRLYVSQQAISEPSVADSTHNRGGKMAKTRKVAKVSVRGKEAAGNRAEQPRTNGGTATGLAAMRIDLMTPSQITSESDFSESETGGKQRKNLQKQSAVRLAALALIDAVAQATNTKTMFGYWHAFFPDEPLRPQSLGLLNCALRDPNARCRAAALHATCTILCGSRSFLTQADNLSGSRPDAYTPFSVALGDMIVSIYAALGRTLDAEAALPVLVQALKCLIVLVQQTTFTRLRRGFIEASVVQPVRRLIRHIDINVQVAALIVLQELISRGDKSSEIFDFIGIAQKPAGRLSNKARLTVDTALDDEVIQLDERAESDSDDELQDNPVDTNTNETANFPEDTARMSWLLQAALENLGVNVGLQQLSDEPNTTPQAIRIESLQVISTMSRNFVLIMRHLDVIVVALAATLGDSAVDVQLHAVKCIDVIGHFMNIFLLEDKPTSDDQRACQHFWQSTTPQLLDKVAQPDSAHVSLQSNCCDALSNISAPIFERLPVYEQRFLVCALNGAVQSADAAIRGAAIRALGVYVLFPTLRVDSHFVENTVETIVESMPADANMDVRVKCSWALANVTNALLLQQADGETNNTNTNIDATSVVGVGTIGDAHLKQLFETVLACRYNDKVRSNAVRALGNLLRLIGRSHMAHTYWQDLCRTAIVQLRDSACGAGNMKVKWNACYALGNCMHNAVFFEASFANCWLPLVLPTLCKLIVDAANFKVRINAAAALAVPAQRAWLAEHYVPVWSSLLEALEQSDRIADFNEYQHRDILVDQLCITVAHYIRLAGVDDLPALADHMQRFDAVPAKWARVINRILPERATALLTAAAHLRRCAAEQSAEAHAARALCECFISVVR